MMKNNIRIDAPDFLGYFVIFRISCARLTKSAETNICFFFLLSLLNGLHVRTCSHVSTWNDLFDRWHGILLEAAKNKIVENILLNITKQKQYY